MQFHLLVVKFNSMCLNSRVNKAKKCFLILISIFLCSYPQLTFSAFVVDPLVCGLPVGTCSPAPCSFRYAIRSDALPVQMNQLPVDLSGAFPGFCPASPIIFNIDTITSSLTLGFSGPISNLLPNSSYTAGSASDYSGVSYLPSANSNYSGIINAPTAITPVVAASAAGRLILSSGPASLVSLKNQNGNPLQYVRWQAANTNQCPVQINDFVTDLPFTQNLNPGDTLTWYNSKAPAADCDSVRVQNAQCRIDIPYVAGAAMTPPNPPNIYLGCNDGCDTTAAAYGYVAHGDSRQYYPASAPDCNTAGVVRTCDNGTLNGDVSKTNNIASCVSNPNCPSGEVKSWGAGCNGTTSASGTLASTENVVNTNPGFNGNAALTCTGSGWSVGATVCNANPPAVGTCSWVQSESEPRFKNFAFLESLGRMAINKSYACIPNTGETCTRDDFVGDVCAVEGATQAVTCIDGCTQACTVPCQITCVCNNPPVVLCGTAAGTTVGAKPTTDLCSDGSTPVVSDWGSYSDTRYWTWSCGSNSCFADSTMDWRFCFVGGTQVTMADGATKNIEDVQVGEKVLTYDEVSKQQVIRPVAETFHHESRWTDLYSFEFSDGSNVTSNDEHRFFIADREIYLSAEQIFKQWSLGEEITMLNSNRQFVQVVEITIDHKNVPLFNLHVDGLYDQGVYNDLYTKSNHNYFAGNILAHNVKDCGGLSSSTEVRDFAMTCETGNELCNLGTNVMGCKFGTLADYNSFCTCMTGYSGSCGSAECGTFTPSCQAQTLTWGGGNCSAIIPATVHNTTTVGIVNTAPGYTGTAQYRCENEATGFTLQPGSSCNVAVAGCPTQAISWFGCSATVTGVAASAVSAPTASTNGTVGTATFQCRADSTWEPTGPEDGSTCTGSTDCIFWYATRTGAFADDSVPQGSRFIINETTFERFIRDPRMIRILYTAPSTSSNICPSPIPIVGCSGGGTLTTEWVRAGTCAGGGAPVTHTLPGSVTTQVNPSGNATSPTCPATLNPGEYCLSGVVNTLNHCRPASGGIYTAAYCAPAAVATCNHNQIVVWSENAFSCRGHLESLTGFDALVGESGQATADLNGNGGAEYICGAGGIWQMVVGTNVCGP